MKMRENPEFPRAIFHMDGDSFFVAVEVAKDPKLRGLPVVTGAERGIVTAASYEAKALGVPRGMPIFQLKKQFPQVIIMPGDYASYMKYSEAMFDIVRRYIDDVEEYSIDECFADMTGLDWPLKMSYEEIARMIQQEITKELDLSISVGLSSTKVLAKVASKWKKPNGFTVIPHSKIDHFLKDIPVYKLWGVGPQTSQLLMRKGVHTAHELAQKDIAWIENVLSKPYMHIWQELRGESVLAIDPDAKTVYASIQKTRTFYPTTNEKKFLISQISKHLEEACSKARYYHLAPKKVSVFLKLQTFRYVRAEIVLSIPTNAPSVILPYLERELDRIHRKGVLYRSAGVVLQNLVSTEMVQQDLFGDSGRIQKFEAIHEQIDELEKKFGKHVVHLASTKHALGEKKIGTDADGTDRNILFL